MSVNKKLAKADLIVVNADAGRIQVTILLAAVLTKFGGSIVLGSTEIKSINPLTAVEMKTDEVTRTITLTVVEAKADPKELKAILDDVAKTFKDKGGNRVET